MAGRAIIVKGEAAITGAPRVAAAAVSGFGAAATPRGMAAGGVMDIWPGKTIGMLVTGATETRGAVVGGGPAVMAAEATMAAGLIPSGAPAAEAAMLTV